MPALTAPPDEPAYVVVPNSKLLSTTFEYVTLLVPALAARPSYTLVSFDTVITSGFMNERNSGAL